VAAALSGVVAGLTVHTVQQQDQSNTVNAQASAMSLLFSAPDARGGAARVRTGGTALVVESRSRDEAVIALSGLAALPRGKAYQLWMIGPGGIRPGGLVASWPKAVAAAPRQSSSTDWATRAPSG
jgi:hypothetical protein